MAMAAQQGLHMNAGVGDKSYAANSLMQKKVLSEEKLILEENMRRVYATILPECLKVADLGCSSGPNTLQLVSDIMDMVDTTCCHLNLRLPVFQFFLNDLFGNDFNTLFSSLPQFFKTLEENKGDKFGQCFINATPGSFYQRLFPCNSMHFFHSSYSVHWLSQAPKELTNGAEPPNKEIHITSKSPPSMHRAYLAQFQHDFKSFLKARSQELVPSGGMVLTLSGTDQEITRDWELIGMALNDMLSENLIEEEKLESFYIPLYEPRIEEAKQVIEEEGSFTIQRLETIMIDWGANINESCADDDNSTQLMKGEFITKIVRSIMEPLLKAQFGEQVMDELFLRFKYRLVQQMMEEETSEEFPTIVISLVKNA